MWIINLNEFPHGIPTAQFKSQFGIHQHLFKYASPPCASEIVNHENASSTIFKVIPKSTIQSPWSFQQWTIFLLLLGRETNSKPKRWWRSARIYAIEAHKLKDKSPHAMRGCVLWLRGSSLTTTRLVKPSHPVSAGSVLDAWMLAAGTTNSTQSPIQVKLQ